MAYENISVPDNGSAIVVNTDFSLEVPNTPIIPFIEGDGIGSDIIKGRKSLADDLANDRSKDNYDSITRHEEVQQDSYALRSPDGLVRKRRGGQNQPQNMECN